MCFYYVLTLFNCKYLCLNLAIRYLNCYASYLIDFVVIYSYLLHFIFNTVLTARIEIFTHILSFNIANFTVFQIQYTKY